VQWSAGAWLLFFRSTPHSVMTKRLYYDSSEIHEFDSVVEEVAPLSPESRPAVILRETAFYPTSGGQVHDTGWLTLGGERLRVAEVADTEDGRIVHYLDAPVGLPLAGAAVHGSIDAARRQRPHAATFRTACSLGSFYRALPDADRFVPHGRIR
jgi:Ser-tRNA(Ala) deacylase AlaX